MKIEKDVFQKPLSSLSLAPIILINENDSLEKVVTTFQIHKIGALPVKKEDKLSGIITERDLVQKLDPFKGIKDPDKTIVQLMTPNPNCLNVNDSFEKALTLMIKRGFRHIPILDNNKLPVSMISVKDILGHLVGFFKDTLQEMGTTTSREILIHDAHTEIFGSNENIKGMRQISEEIIYAPLYKVVRDNPVSLDKSASLEDALQAMQTHKSTSIVVTEFETKVIGIMTERDFIFKIYGKNILGKHHAVSQYMTPNPHCLLSRHQLGHAINNMFDNNYRHIIIVDEEGQLTAVIGLLDILKYFTMIALG